MEFPFPILGIDRGRSTRKQPNLTAYKLQNVRPYDTLSTRIRGGQRPGLDKLYAQQIGGAAQPIVAMCTVTVVTSN
ncbi:MAG: hypothetical protein IMZ53_02925 [Thermoplasmata archaeon]|nr:hypothetical protein [Thermoplasmata archaeon]